MFLRIVLLVVGAACVLLGVVVLFSWFGQVRSSRTPAETRIEIHAQAIAQVLAAAHAIKRGIPLQKGDVVSKALKPDERLLPGSLEPGQEQEFIGALSLQDFAAGDTLFVSEFVKPKNWLAAELRPGHLALTIFVDPAQSVAGLALPGDLVDVVLIQSFDERTAPDPRRRTSGETVLRGVRVLAVDQQMSPPAGVAATIGMEPHAPKTVTLEVTEQQAKKLLVASKLGAFELSLLPLDAMAEADPPKDAGAVWASDVSPAIGDLFASAAAERAAAAAAPRCPPVTGSTLDKSVRCVPSNRAPSRAPVAAGSPPEAAEQARPPSVRVAPASGAQGNPND